MGLVVQVHHLAPETRNRVTRLARTHTTFHIRDPSGQDVTAQIRSLGRRGLLPRMTYTTYEEVD